jgi:hypothetical protein
MLLKKHLLKKAISDSPILPGPVCSLRIFPMDLDTFLGNAFVEKSRNATKILPDPLRFRIVPTPPFHHVHQASQSKFVQL